MDISSNRCCKLTYTAPCVETSQKDFEKIACGIVPDFSRLQLVTENAYQSNEFSIIIFYSVVYKDTSRQYQCHAQFSCLHTMFRDLVRHIQSDFKSITIDGFSITVANGYKFHVLNNNSVQVVKALYPSLEFYFKDLRFTNSVDSNKEELEKRHKEIKELLIQQRDLLIELIAKLSWDQDKMRLVTKNETGSLDN